MDLFKLVARLGLDRSGYEKGMDEAVSSGKSFANRLGSGLKTAAKVGAAALSAAATGIAALTKQSVAQYAEYEQLVGGVETLFKGSADRVQEYAANAYRTAGLSANDYMTTVTSFSASLLQSLGGDTAAAADLADQAITDMSDNANKMGTDMAAIQNAYNGFAKQNFTMLDNLKLGYGGTKQEMERLLADAEKLSGQKFDISSYADIVRAIHAVQTEMGITGTTAKEASETISGSIASLKSAWANLVAGLGDENANFEQLIGNVVDSAVTAGNNLIPRIQQVLFGVATLVEKLAPVIADKLPQLVEQILPPLLNAASSLVQAVVQSLPSIIKVLVDALPPIIEMLITTLAEMAPELVDLAILLIVALADGLVAAVPVLIEKAPEIISRLVDALIKNAPLILEAGIKLIAALAQGIVQSVGTVVSAIGQIGKGIFDGIGNLVSSAWEWGKDLIDNFAAGIRAFISKPIEAVKGLAGKIKSFLGFSEPEEGPLSDFHTFAPDMMQLFAQGIRDNVGLITDAIGTGFDIGPVIQSAAAPAGNTPGQEITVPRGNRPIEITFVLDGVKRYIYKATQEESQRVGIVLA